MLRLVLCVYLKRVCFLADHGIGTKYQSPFHRSTCGPRRLSRQQQQQQVDTETLSRAASPPEAAIGDCSIDAQASIELFPVFEARKSSLRFREMLGPHRSSYESSAHRAPSRLISFLRLYRSSRNPCSHVEAAQPSLKNAASVRRIF